MSGDVQPKKRKDKRKKKEDHQEDIHQPPTPTPPTLVADDTNIHIHKEKTIGGGICAKCIFFIITLAIAIVLGYTIVENRGLTDIDIPLSESRFAAIFEGWIDTSDHDDHHDEVAFDDHDDHEDEDEGIGSEEEHQESEEDEHQESEEDEHQESEDDEHQESEEEEDEESEQDVGSEQEEIDQEESEQEEIDQEESEQEENDQEESEQEEIDQEESEQQESEQEESEQVDEESQEIQAESDDQDEEEEQEDDQNDDENDNQSDNEEESKEEQTQISDEQEDEVSEEVVKKKSGIAKRSKQKDVSTEDKDDDQDGDENDAEDVTNGANTGRVQESESDDEKQIKKRSGAQAYEFENITNSEDYLIRDSLDTAERHLPNNLPLALNLFIKILEDHPDSPRALYGRARTLDQLAEKKRSNEILQESIKYFAKVLNAKHVPDALFLAAAKRCIERMRFIGIYAKSIEIHQKLLEKFPNEIKYRNDFAVTLLTINKIATARTLLLETLEKWPEDGFALVHYGFILKTVDNNLSLAIEYLTKGIATKEVGVIDGRFYFHLGDALARIGKSEEAIKIYEDGVANRVFLSKYQRSLYNVNRLTGKPFWEPEQTPYDKLYELLHQNWKEIRKEGLSMLDKKGYFKDESENLKDVGDWKQFELYARGVKNKENCIKCPITCQIIESSPETRTCRRGQVKFSVMHPGTHVWPHCGPTNCRLRVHLGLKVPPKTYIRVAEEIRSWEEGKIIVFDDSFEHEVWHNGTEYRLVLIVDVWHPELTKAERVNLSPI